MFIIPARRVGRRLQDISREQMQYNAAMNTQMTERFNVAGASLVKLFGSLDRENDSFGRRANAVRDAGIRSAMLGRVFFVALGLVAAVGTAAIYGVGAQLVVSGDITSGTLVALAALVDARLPTADRAHQRPRRPDDVDGLVRARVRGARRARADHRSPWRDRSRRADGHGSSSATSRSAIRRRSSRRSPRWSSTSIPGADPDRDVLTDLSLADRTGRDAGAGRRIRCRQEHDWRRSSRASTTSPTGAVADRRRRRARPHARPRCGRGRCGGPGSAPVPRVDRRQPAVRPARRHRRRARRGVRGGTHPPHDRRPARRLRHGRRRARLPACRAARSSGWRSPGCCSRTRRS